MYACKSAFLSKLQFASLEMSTLNLLNVGKYFCQVQVQIVNHNNDNDNNNNDKNNNGGLLC